MPGNQPVLTKGITGFDNPEVNLPQVIILKLPHGIVDSPCKVTENT